MLQRVLEVNYFCFPYDVLVLGNSEDSRAPYICIYDIFSFMYRKGVHKPQLCIRYKHYVKQSAVKFLHIDVLFCNFSLFHYFETDMPTTWD